MARSFSRRTPSPSSPPVYFRPKTRCQPSSVMYLSAGYAASTDGAHVSAGSTGSVSSLSLPSRPPLPCLATYPPIMQRGVTHEAGGEGIAAPPHETGRAWTRAAKRSDGRATSGVPFRGTSACSGEEEEGREEGSGGGRDEICRLLQVERSPQSWKVGLGVQGFGR